MPINQLVAYCRDSITKHGKCDDCKYQCDNICNNCLQHSHFDDARTYDCQNMIYCYTSSYIYKYASEITHLFNLLKYNTFTHFNILNLGCGSCADLFGIYQHLMMSERNIPVNYTGVDINERWLDSQEKIVQIFSNNPNYSITFIKNDVFLFLDGIEDDELLNFNIVTLQYILNELNKHCMERMEEFVEKFVRKVINKMPDNSTVIINDINHFEVRRWFDAIFTKAQESNLVSSLRKRFTEPTTVPKFDYDFYKSDNLEFETIDFGQRIKTPCSSAQFVIYKTKNK